MNRNRKCRSQLAGESKRIASKLAPTVGDQESIASKLAPTMGDRS